MVKSGISMYQGMVIGICCVYVVSCQGRQFLKGGEGMNVVTQAYSRPIVVGPCVLYVVIVYRFDTTMEV